MTDNVYTYIKSNVEPFLLDPPPPTSSVAIWPHC